MRVAPEIVLTDEERAELTKLARSKLTMCEAEQRRARIVLLAAEGWGTRRLPCNWAWVGCRSRAGARPFGGARLAGIELDVARGAPPSKAISSSR